MGDFTDLSVIRGQYIDKINVYFHVNRETGVMATKTSKLTAIKEGIFNEHEILIFIDTYPEEQALRLVSLIPVINTIIQAVFQHRAGTLMGNELKQLSAENFKAALNSLTNL